MWIEPKTDWNMRYDTNGLFIGDFINVTDYNRIKNNLLYLRELAAQLIYNMPTIVVGADKHLPDNNNPDFDNDNFFADEFNMIEDALEILDDAIGWIDFGVKQTFYENGRMIGMDELNRIESAELTLYNLLTNSLEGKKRLSFRLGAGNIKV